MTERIVQPSDREMSEAIIRLAVGGVEMAAADYERFVHGSQRPAKGDTSGRTPASSVGRWLAWAIHETARVPESGLSKREAFGRLALRVLFVLVYGVPWIVGLVWLGLNVR